MNPFPTHGFAMQRVYLLFEVTYCESVGYNVYELDRATGKPELVFEIAYGC